MRMRTARCTSRAISSSRRLHWKRNTIRPFATISQKYRQGPMSKLFSPWRSKYLAVAALALLSGVRQARAADTVPDWFRQLAKAPVLHYSDEANAVVLLDDETLTVKENGEMYVNYRRVVKIL